jgi:Tfp pilus assembly protein PilF
MTKGCHRVQKGILAAVVFLTGIAGCQHTNPHPAAACLTTGGTDLTGKLTAKQTADVQVALAYSLEGRGETAQAAALYEEALKKDPTRSDAWLRLAILHDQQGQFGESATMYQKALKAQPGSAEIYCDMGYSLYLQQRWSEAEMNLRQALALQPDLARAHNNLGLVLARTGQEREALAEFHKAGCDDAAARVNLAFALTLERNWPEARQQYQAALRIDSSSVAAQNGLRELDQLVARMDSTVHLSQPNALGPEAIRNNLAANHEP